MTTVSKYLINIIAATFVGSLLLFLPGTLFAHEFWLLPDQFNVPANGSVIVRFRVGEHFAGDNWKGNKNNVMQLLLTHPNGRTINLESLIGEAKGDSIHLEKLYPGTQMTMFHSTKNFIELKAEDFNAYLKEDGLTEALEYRTKHNELEQPAKENYQRCAKTIFYSGNPTQAAITQPTTLPLDIVPLNNVYSYKPLTNLKMRFVVYFKGLPLPNTSVKTWHKLPNGKVEEQIVKTDKKGRLKLAIATTGTWMISIVKMIHNDGDDVPWQSYWGSLTWGYE